MLNTLFGYCLNIMLFVGIQLMHNSLITMEQKPSAQKPIERRASLTLGFSTPQVTVNNKTGRYLKILQQTNPQNSPHQKHFLQEIAPGKSEKVLFYLEKMRFEIRLLRANNQGWHSFLPSQESCSEVSITQNNHGQFQAEFN